MARRTTPDDRLSRERIVITAIDIADRDGIDAVSMRKLADALGFDPMSLYNHVRDKNDLLAAMTDAVVTEIEPVAAGDWQASLRATILAARTVMLTHPWAARVIADREQPTPAVLRYINVVLEIVRSGGFSVALGHHTIHALGSRILGFSQDLFIDSTDDPPPPELVILQARAWEESHPRLAELALAGQHDGTLGPCDDNDEFAFALDLIIEGLERRRLSDAVGF